MAAIGNGWAADAFVEAGWVTTAGSPAWAGGGALVDDSSTYHLRLRDATYSRRFSWRVFSLLFLLVI